MLCRLFLLLSLTGMLVGCGGDSNKGVNRDRDRPRSASDKEKEKDKAVSDKDKAEKKGEKK